MNIFTAVGNLDELVLGVADVRFEAVVMSHFDGEEVMIILLDFLVGGVLGEERLWYLFETIEQRDDRE